MYQKNNSMSGGGTLPSNFNQMTVIDGNGKVVSNSKVYSKERSMAIQTLEDWKGRGRFKENSGISQPKSTASLTMILKRLVGK